MHSSLIAWIMRAIPFGTIIMYGALGETVTEKSGNLNQMCIRDSLKADMTKL